MRNYIRVLNGMASGEEVLLDQSMMTCGRHYGNDLTLVDKDVSRHHCRFVRVEGSTYVVEDAGSSNGTYVNGILIRYKILTEGDQIRIGSTLLEMVSKEVDSLDNEGSGELLGDCNFEAEAGTAKPFLDSPVGTYEGVSNEQSFFELETDLDFVYRASTIASKNLTVESLCQSFAKLVGDWAGVGQSLLVLLDESGKDFSQSFMLREPNEDSSSAQSSQVAETKFNRELVDRVLTSRLPSMSTFEVSSERSQKITALCVPIDNGDKLLGLIYVDDLQPLGEQAAGAISSNGLGVLAAIGKQAAAAIENNVYFRSALADARKEAVENLTSVFSHRINNLLHLVSGSGFLIDAGLKANNLNQVSEGWSTVWRTQNRISQLSTNMAFYCREFEPLLRETKPHGIIQLITSEMAADFGETRLSIVHHTDSDLSLRLDSYFFERAIRNILFVGFWASGNGQNGQDVVTLETALVDDWFVMRVSFRHFDDRFNLAEFESSEINSVSAELGFLEMHVSRGIVGSQAGTLVCSTDAENFNTIEVRFPLVGND